MVPDPYDLYDDDVRTRTRWALREGLVLGGILLFWVALAVALSLVLLVVSAPFALFRWGAPGLPVAAVVWTLVGPLAAANAALYALARVGTLLLDRYRAGGTPVHPLSEAAPPSTSTGAADEAGPGGADEAEGATEERADPDDRAEDATDGEGDPDGAA